MKLYISGNKHISLDNSTEEEKIRGLTDQSIDVIFEEADDAEISEKEKLVNSLACPVIFSALVLYLALLKGGRILLASDQEMQSNFEAEMDADVVQVDHPLHRIITGARNLWMMANYISLLPFFLFAYLGSASGMFWSFVFAIVVLFPAFVASVNSTRNMTMVMKIDRVARMNKYETGVMFVGGGHKEELENLLRDYSDAVQIMD